MKRMETGNLAQYRGVWEEEEGFIYLETGVEGLGSLGGKSRFTRGTAIGHKR